MAEGDSPYDSTIKHVGATELLNFRLERGWTKKHLSTELGISTRDYYRYEKGERPVPASVRCAMLYKFQHDLLPAEELARHMGVTFAPAREPVPTVLPTPSPEPELDFWAKQREELQRNRRERYSKTGQKLLKVRDNAFASATAYVGVKHLALIFDLPFGLEIHGVDWAFLASYLIITTAALAIVSELPLIKIARHLLGRSQAS
ncbi:helix-turn-helix domain-containing protein [Thioclava sp. GXIMD4215]|uniref:helix-turn-helix domain-containing protein n=1 Tax=Thioclava sp. GXIMD4215 TaxID=3131928 RepID=UPI0032563895